MLLTRRSSRLLLSLLIMLIVAARAEAQRIPVPAESPRAGAQSKPAARGVKPAWHAKGAVVPAQADEPAEPEGTEPTLAPPLEEPAAEMQTLRAPANAAEAKDELEADAQPARPLPAYANPLRQASRPQYYAQQRSPYQRVQNPAELEVDPEPVARPEPPRMLQDAPSPRVVSPREAWQVAPGQRPSQRFYADSNQGHQYPPDIDNPTVDLRVQNHDGQYPDGQYPDGQVPGEELYGLPRHFETNAYGRFSGRGEPLTAGSWLNRPYYVGGFIGGLGGDTLIAGEINANGSFIWGGNIGWDYDPYWGLEMRLAFSDQGLNYFANPAFDNASNGLILWDTSFIYYPWGDARWRPYIKIGFGFADFDFTTVDWLRHSDMVYEMPIGIGLKYRVNQYWVWRFDATDNLIFGGNAGLETQNQFSLTAGLEWRFGGRRQSYWPWNPSRRWN